MRGRVSREKPHSPTRERVQESAEGWKLDTVDPGVDTMINLAPTSSEARELIGLAERMGIPTEDAVHSVLQHLTNQELSEDLFDSRELVRLLSA
jgi:hypothetical protein